MKNFRNSLLLGVFCLVAPTCLWAQDVRSPTTKEVIFVIEGIKDHLKLRDDARVGVSEVWMHTNKNGAMTTCGTLRLQVLGKSQNTGFIGVYFPENQRNPRPKAYITVDEGKPVAKLICSQMGMPLKSSER